MRDLRLQMAELHKALMLFVQTAQLDDSIAMEVAGLYPTWEELVQKKKTVKAKTVFRYGVNSVGDPQLYSFVSDYIPSEIYTPPEDITHYKAVGLGADGKAIWTQPYGATDAYQAGDEVWHNGQEWVSDIADNVWEPGVHGWSQKTIEQPPVEDPVNPPVEEPPVEMNGNQTVKWGLWQNPMLGTVGLYHKDDGVTDDAGVKWISLHDNNGNPPADGWWVRHTA